MVISVREATLGDLDTINKMAVETFYETYSWYNTPEDMEEYTRVNFSKEQILRDLKTAGSFFFVAVINNQIIGYAKLGSGKAPEQLNTKNHIEIERIYVAQKYQNLKAGYALIKKCIETAREKNLDTIWLGVWKKNTKATAFYQRVGFKIFGEHVFRLGKDPQDDYLMKYDIN